MREKRYAIGITLIVLLILLNISRAMSDRVKSFTRELAAPFHTLVSNVSGRIGDGLAALVASGDRAASRETLIKRNAILEQRIRELEALERENANLRQQLGITRRARRRLIMCEVINRGDASGWWATVRLNRGRASGIEPDMAVITPQGLVGKTTAVSKHTCDVLLVTDANCGVSARLSRSGAFGIVRGVGVTVSGDAALDMHCPLDPCRIDYVSLNAEIDTGDEVVTSGLGGTYPAGISVGTVLSVDIDESGLYQSAQVMPSADLRKLRYVFVVSEKEPEE